MTMSGMTGNRLEGRPLASRVTAGRGDREALLNLYDALDPAGRAELLRLAVGLVRRPPTCSPGPEAGATG